MDVRSELRRRVLNGVNDLRHEMLNAGVEARLLCDVVAVEETAEGVTVRFFEQDAQPIEPLEPLPDEVVEPHVKRRRGVAATGE
jgi:hypothetical protein